MTHPRLFLLAAFTLLSSFALAQKAEITRLTGVDTVTVTLPGEAGEQVMLGQGAEIPAGSRVEVPAAGKLFLRTFAGTVSVFSGGADFEVQSVEMVGDKEVTTINLKHGDLVANLDPKKRPVTEYGVVTPRGVAAARGTNYTVSVNGSDVVVTVVAGVVSVEIPDVGVVPLNPGEATANGTQTTIADALSNAATSSAVSTALQAAAAAVATLAATGTDGVSNETLTAVISTASAAAASAGQDDVVALVAATAVQANPGAAESVVEAAVAVAPSAANSVVASVAAELQTISSATETPTQTVSRLANAARRGNSNAVVDESAVEDAMDESGDTGSDTESETETETDTDPEADPEVEIEVPTDNIVVSPSS